MADKFPKKVLFNNGEGVDYADFNLMQDRMHAHFTDAFLAHKTRRGVDPQFAALTASTVWAFGDGGAVYSRGTIGLQREITFISGLIGINVNPGPATGDQQFLTYWLDAGDVPDKVRPSPGAGNERWDVLTVDLAQADDGPESRDFKDAVTGALTTNSINKNRGVVATFTWTQGVAAPVGSATVPSSPSTILCAVLVQDAKTIDAEFNEIQDHRFPIGGVKQYSEAPFQVGLRNPSAVIINEDGVMGMSFLLTTGQDVELYSKCPIVSHNHRIASLQVDSSVPPAAATFTERIVRPNEVTITPSTSGMAFRYNFINEAPLWANGYSAGVAAAIEGMFPEGVVWKGRALSNGASSGYNYNGLLWTVFGE